MAVAVQVTESSGDGSLLDVKVNATPDCGGRGRPRVMLNTAAVLSATGMRVHKAFVGVLSPELAADTASAALMCLGGSPPSEPVLQVLISTLLWFFYGLVKTGLSYH
jgi:hypothetical protein